MATATRKSSGAESAKPPNAKGPGSSKNDPRPGPLRVLRSVYRFLASLTLAIFTISTLVVVLTAGMIFERAYGNHALQEYFYRTWWFGLLLVMLALNILCAATIRYPWKRRQAGFVVTHAGLLVLLVGSWISFQVGDEGQVGLVEGDRSATLSRVNNYRIRVQPLDPESGEPKGDGYAFPFYPGAFNWKAGRTERLSRSNDPFELNVTSFFPASGPRFLHRETEAGGLPMIRLAAKVTPPNSTASMDLFANDLLERDRWLTVDPVFLRKAQMVGPALFRFSYLDPARDADLIADFTDLPGAGKVEFARLRYTDAKGAERLVSYTPSIDTWDLGGGQSARGRAAALPDSDLSVTYQLSGSPADPAVFDRLKTEFELGQGENHSHIRLVDFLMTVVQGTGEPEIPFIEFAISKAGGPPVTHWGTGVARVATLAFQPGDHDPNVLAPATPLVRLSYFMPPTFSADMSGLKGIVDIVGTTGGKLLYRSMNDDGVQGSGRLELAEMVDAFGGSPNQPMRLSLGVDEFLQSGREEFTFIPVEMPVGSAGNGTPAAHVSLTVRGDEQEEWVRLAITPDMKVDPRESRTFKFPRAHYKVWFDVDRKELPFNLKLVDFRRRFDPGVGQASSYESDVLLSDDELKVDNKKINISMNEPLTHRGYTFYQSSFDPPSDGSGQFVSVFQVRYDPLWQVVYLGCLMIVVGAFMQFYMRAGVFTDGGKKERERAGPKGSAAGVPAPPSLDEPL